jgi:hypothetical protein
MATRCIVQFKANEKDTNPAQVYRHWDGYPDGAGADIVKFIEELKANIPDNRLSDASYLAARYVVWLADQFREEGAHRLDFLSVGIVAGYPAAYGIDYLYKIVCEGPGKMKITAYRESSIGRFDKAVWTATG